MQTETTIQEEFEAYDAAHPDVYQLFKRFAEEAYDAGRLRLGAKLLIERIRWYYTTSSKDEEFKINNNFPSRYARKLIAEDPKFANLFELRKIQTP